MTEYVITIQNGNYPLTYRATTITDAFQCLMAAAENGKLAYGKDSLKLLDPDELMSVLVSMKYDKCFGFETGAGYKIERVTVPDPPSAPPAEVPDWLKAEQKKWRRFELTATDKAQMDELNVVLENGNFTRRELALIVTCLQLRPEFTLDDFTAESDSSGCFAKDDP